MPGEGSEYELMFGDTCCLITISAAAGPERDAPFQASAFVLGYRGLTMRAVADRDGTPVTFPTSSEEAALAAASGYLQERFGPCRAAPAPTTSYVTSREEVRPAVCDERPEPMLVVALERIRRGDCVIVGKDGARPAQQRLIRRLPGQTFALAVEDIEAGGQGRVRAVPKEDLEL